MLRALLACLLALPVAAQQRHVVLLAGDHPGDHGADAHDYPGALASLVRDLEGAGLRATLVTGGWPEDEALLDDADTIVLYSDGADRDPARHPFLAAAGRLEAIDRQMDRGCGLVVLHWATIVPNQGIGERYLEWIGGHFDHQSGTGPNGWASKITHAETEVRAPLRTHPVVRGLPEHWRQRDEWYYDLRLGADHGTVLPVAYVELADRLDLVAWSLERTGGGRGFGFTGGHWIEVFEQPECRRMLLNAILWTAGARVPEGGATITPRPLLVPGHFGRALDTTATDLAFAPREEYGAAPFSVECLVRAADPAPFQVFVSNQLKGSGGHWELYGYAGRGDLSVHLPGYEPAEIRSGALVVDGAWHHVGFTFDGDEVALFVDGVEVKRQALRPNGKPVTPGPLFVGAAAPDAEARIRARAEIDELRLSLGLRDLTRVPAAPHEPDERTVGLWHFDDDLEDRSALANPGAFVPPPAWTPRVKSRGDAEPYELETDADWHDDRFGKMDTGPFLMHSIVTRGVPGRTQVNKALVLNADGYNALYDLETVEFVAEWSGPRLEIDDVRFGLLRKPVMGGPAQVLGIGPPDQPRRFRGLRVVGDRVLLEYEQAGRRILAEWPAYVGTNPVEDPGPPARRYDDLVTQGVLGVGPGPYVVDTITLPHDNPWGALLFASGVGFLPDGDGVICTAHGDVWTVSGLDGDLSELRWTRFATGLYQPLGLQVVDGEVIVLARDRLWRLHDTNDDGEADWYESFNDDLEVAGEDHAYAMDLERGPDGSLYFQKSGGTSTAHGGCTLRVAPDGSKLDVVAHGFRHANGIGVSPEGVVTNADNEGEFIPSTRINWITGPGYHGGYQPSYRGDGDPNAYSPPLCWLPQVADNSAGGQRWVEGDRWGLPAGTMLHTSFGHARLFVVLPETVEGVAQGGAAAFPFTFLSGVCRGRFRPQDGQLYLAGLDGWQTAAVRDGCLQRVRYTGGPVTLPVALAVHADGLRLTFACDLAPASVGPNAFRVERWNYRYSRNYGSKEWSVIDPAREGHDPVPVVDARLEPDGRTVFLALPSIAPVMQQEVTWRLRGAGGRPIEGILHHTIHRLREARDR